MSESAVRTRRRGPELEQALLDAAWEQLVAEGNSRFTVESVAERAHTSKHVVYRRWSDRGELLRATIRDRGRRTAPELRDTGTLRGDILAALRRANTAENDMVVLMGAMLDSRFGELDMTPAQLRLEFLGDRTSSTQRLVDRAIARGEVDPARITPRVVHLPFDLFRHEYLMALGPLPDASLVEIVDEIWLPLLTR